MEIIQNELISFSLITVTVLALAYLTKRTQDKFADEDHSEKD
jgi:hypothetical protein